MNKINKNYKEITFDNIKHIDEDGNEYWEARELQVVLEYKEWRNFELVINKAKDACKGSKNKVSEHFVDVNKLSLRANNAKAKIKDYKLTRYACYLIVQNGDSSKEVIALGQTYFAIQTRKQEISEGNELELSETDKRIKNRNLAKKKNKLLNEAAKNAGVKNFGEFHNAGYKGLYNGETADDIAKRKKLRYREDILDNMGSSELIANLFRIDQTEQKLNNDNIKGEDKANKIHYRIGKNVRDVIAKNGGTMPEKLPTPSRSLKELEKNRKRIS